jgi:colanic acid biosynthesis glycosyl transferase WcaI
MRIILLHQCFYPDLYGSAIRLTELAVELRRLGHDITVFTGRTNKNIAAHASKLEVYQGVFIHRLGPRQLDKNVPLGRILNSLAYFISVFLKVLWEDRRAILFIGTDPPFLPLLGGFLKVLRGQKYVLQIADLYPDIAVQLGYMKPKGMTERLFRWANRFSFTNAEKIITLGSKMRAPVSNYLPNNNGGEKVSIIRGWESREFVRLESKKDNWFAHKYGLDRKMVVLYSGNMGLAHELESVIKAAMLLKDREDIAFLFIGGGGQERRLKSLADELHLTNVVFLPYQPAEHLPHSLTSGEIAVVSMKPGTEGLCMPNKLYTALASGSAILGVVSRETEVADVIEEYHCGLRVDGAKPEAISEAVLRFYNDPKFLQECQKNSRDCFKNHFTKKQALKEYAEVLESSCAST